MKHSSLVILFILFAINCTSQTPRARDLGIPFEGVPGELNAITDVAGVEVGQVTIVSGKGKLIPGKGPVRTGVTAVLPHGKKYDPVFAGWNTLNGNGEMTGTTWLKESGFLEGPVVITNTHSVGIARDAVVEWGYRNRYFDPLPDEPDIYWALPVVAETYDGVLNDINGFHVKKEHVFEALDKAAPGKVEEGNVGGGTGMICHGFKGGIGTSSRKVEILGHLYTVGVLVQANYGSRRNLTIAGVPVGREITDLMPEVPSGRSDEDTGSIIVIVATDAPLLPHQLERIARRVPVGIAKVGGYGANTSGDIFIAFSTANSRASERNRIKIVEMIPNDAISPLFEATAQATEESVVNALVAAEDMTGINNTRVFALPEDRVVQVLRKYNRIK
jgi:L-aminopeptidase/D-esterase-like protein